MVQNDILYTSEAFTVHKDKVIQGSNMAVIHDRNHISSNYSSPASETYPRQISFKFSINEKDNELPFGVDHQVIIGDNDHESPLITFGKMPERITEKPSTYLPPNHRYTFRVDMSPVMEQFEKQGYYEMYNGNRISKDDFKGFYIAGGSEPLSWDFVGLSGKGLKLIPTGEGQIYSITLNMNPYDESQKDTRHWHKTVHTADKPSYISDQIIVDALYNLSCEEAKLNIEADSTLRTGAKWSGVWTRDISYSILLAFAYHEPEIAKISLMKKVSRDRIIQDTGSGGAWPVSSDRTTWALAAWEIYKVTGDKDWLAQSYQIIKNTLEDDYKTLTSTTGMYKGESSFLDWREQTYPKWMNNADIFQSENLGTNVVHYQAHIILASMAKILGEPSESYVKQAENIKAAINQHLWMEEKGYYAQYLYGRKNLVRSDRFEALGEALAILFGVADDEKARSICSKSPLTEYGASCIFPQIPGIPPYHNNGIWPFVQSYWNLAAAKSGNEKALTHGLASIYRAGALFLTNYENFVSQSGDFKGTEINSDRMLWSMAGNLAMVHRVFMGMSFETEGIRFSPAVPKVYGGTKKLIGFKYRNAILNITVNGYGNRIQSFSVNGKMVNDAFLASDISGTVDIIIEMDNQSFDQQNINIVPNQFSLPNPDVKLDGNKLSWTNIPGASFFNVYRNGLFIEKVTENQYTIESNSSAEYAISSVDQFGVTSFISEPILVNVNQTQQLIQVENFAPKSGLPFTNFSADGFVEISNFVNEEITLHMNVEVEGTYFLDMRYANGSGPWNTDNKCCIRSLYCNDNYSGSLVFPQRGTDEWSDWGFSNSIKVDLKKGQNILVLKFEPWNNNMNIYVNRAMLDYVRLVPTK